VEEGSSQREEEASEEGGLNMGSLPDQVHALRRRGLIPTHFRVSDIRNHLGQQYSDNYLRTALANYAEETGNYVQRWSEPRFKRVGRGLYAIN
jgi:hypothetical protein